MRTRLLSVLAVLALGATGCGWSQFGQDPGHGGQSVSSPFFAANEASLTVKQFGGVQPIGQIVTDGDAAFVQQDGALLVLDERSGAVRWFAALPTGSTRGGVPAVYETPTAKTVFVVVKNSAEAVLEGFDGNGLKNCNANTHTCVPVFTAALGDGSRAAGPPVVSNGRVFVNRGYRLLSFDANGTTNCVAANGVSTCTPLWEAKIHAGGPDAVPAVAGATVFDVIHTASGQVSLGAFDAATGALQWSGAIGASTAAGPSVAPNGDVYVSDLHGGAIDAFDGAGCGATTCTRLFRFVAAAGDPAGGFRGYTAFSGSLAFATNSNGRLYTWFADGCGGATCQPLRSSVVNGVGSRYDATPVTTNSVLYVLGRPSRDVDLIAFDTGSGTEAAHWDLQTTHYTSGLAAPSVDGNVVLAPVQGAVWQLRTVEPLASLTESPLALSPAFSPAIHDYTVPCATGTNSLSFSLRAVTGGSVALTAPITTPPAPSADVTVDVLENQAVVVRASDGANASEYWVRCLPHDFPPITVTRHPQAGSPTPGWYLASSTINAPGVAGYAMVLDTNGTPVWYRKSAPGSVSDVQLLPNDTIGYESFTGVAGYGYNSSDAYNLFQLDTHQTTQVRTVGTPTDLHEFLQLPNGDRIIDSYPFKSGVDLSGLQDYGPNSTIADCVLQELDPQGNVVWQWRASDHIDPARESTVPQSTTINGQTVVDVYHCNSVDVDGSGNVLLSARHTDAVFMISKATGKIMWKLSGVPYNKDGAQLIRVVNDPETAFYRQHDARVLANGNITMFDNHTSAGADARGIEYSIDFATSTAQPVVQHTAPNFSSAAMGDYRREPDGEEIIDWGYIRGQNVGFEELDRAGRDVLDVGFGRTYSYRVLKVAPESLDINTLRNAVGAP